jgi:hypothetical protein
MLTKNAYVLKDKIWEDVSKKRKIFKTTYPESYNPKFVYFSNFYEKYSIQKTNLIKIARANRSLIAKARYDLYQELNQKKLEENTIYIAGNLGHLINLKHIFKNENVGFFYRDNFWIIIKNEKNLMNNFDLKKFNEMNPSLLEINKKKKVHFNKSDGYFGFGWSHNFKKEGIWSDGKLSTLLFSLKNDLSNRVLEINCKPYITKKNKVLDIDIYINDQFNKNIKLSSSANNEKNQSILINLDKNFLTNIIKVDFKIKNPISPLEVLESPDSRKLGILVKSLELKKT